MATTLPSTLTLEEVSTLVRLSQRVVLEQVEAGKIPAQKMGEIWQFSRVEVEYWSEHHDQRNVLLRQVGAMAHDDTMEALQAHIDRQRQQNTLE
jgi:excisionase family DNA binding protein